jgi:hypothetical protein
MRRLVAELIILLAVLPFAAPFGICSAGDLFSDHSPSAGATIFTQSSRGPGHATILDHQQSEVTRRQTSHSQPGILADAAVVDALSVRHNTSRLSRLHQRPFVGPSVALRI